MFSLPERKLDPSMVTEVYEVASFYNLCVEVIPQVGSDVLVGLSCSNSLLPAKLWYFLRCGCTTSVKTVTQAVLQNDRLASVLSLFCQVSQHLLKSVLFIQYIYSSLQKKVCELVPSLCEGIGKLDL